MQHARSAALSHVGVNLNKFNKIEYLGVDIKCLLKFNIKLIMQRDEEKMVD